VTHAAAGERQTLGAENRQLRTISLAENKTKPTDASVDDYIASRANAQQHADCRKLMALFKRVTRQTPRMWGPSIVGYGSCWCILRACPLLLRASPRDSALCTAGVEYRS
jgi:hypothetical protein